MQPFVVVLVTIRFNADTRPVAQNLAPADGTVVVTAPNLEWTYFDADGDPLVDSEVELAENPAFSPVKWQTSVTGPATSLQIPAAEVSPGTTYYWRVRTSDGYMWSAYTVPWRFKMDSKPVARNVAPADGILTTSTPTLEWAYSDADGEPLLNTESTGCGRSCFQSPQVANHARRGCHGRSAPAGSVD